MTQLPPDQPTRRRFPLRHVLSVAVSLGLVVAVARVVDPDAFLDALRRFAWWRVAATALLAMVVVGLRALRARLLMPPGPSFRVVLSAVSLGFLASMASP